MKLYWPMAIDTNGEKHWTYNGCQKVEDCRATFKCWEDDYHYILEKMWIDVTDSDNKDYEEKILVERTYIFTWNNWDKKEKRNEKRRYEI